MELFQDAKTGEYWQRMPGGRYAPVAPDQVGAAQEGTMGALASGVGTTGLQLMAGIPAMFGNEGAQQLVDYARGQQEVSSRNNPIASILGQSVLPVAAGVASAGLGIPGMMATEAAMNAPLNPEAPFTGAAIGAAGVGIPAAAVVGGTMAARVARSMIQGKTGVPGLPMSGELPTTAGQRYSGAPGEIDNRVRNGDLTADWFDKQGVPLYPDQRIRLTATTPEEMQVAKQVQFARELGGDQPAIRMAQRDAFSTFIKDKADIPAHQAITPATRADLFTEVGDGINRLTSVSGDIPVAPEAMKAMKEVVAGANMDFQHALGRQVDNIAESMKANAGAVDPVRFQSVLTKLNEMAAGGNYEKALEAGKIAEHLHDSLYATLSAGEKAELQQLRYRYRIAKTLNTRGVVGDDGYINVPSFQGAWSKRTPLKGLGKDEIGQAAQTFAGLGYREAHTGSTLTRLQTMAAKAPGVIKKEAPGAALTVLGLTGLNSAANKLLGD